MMETQADQLASDFLVPPQYDLNRLAELYTEAGRRVAPEEHAWRFLRPLFPDTTERLGWSNYDRMSAQARADLNVAVDSPESLFHRMLRAIVLRLEDAEEPVMQPFQEGLERVNAELDVVFEIALEHGVEEAREILASRYDSSEVAPLPNDIVCAPHRTASSVRASRARWHQSGCVRSRAMARSPPP